jgi:lipopolysaccharide/colanic/teichoic acid biosynthesis glycosyltransferase
MRKTGGFCRTATITIPRQWEFGNENGGRDVVRYSQDLSVCFEHSNRLTDNSWVEFSDGRFLTTADSRLFRRQLADTCADVVTVNIIDRLQASYEKVLTAPNNELVGFRLFYEDAAQPTAIPRDWPHHLFVRSSALNRLLTGGGLPLAFDKFIETCHSKSLSVHSVNLGGSALDLTKEGDLLKLMQHRLNSSAAAFADNGENGDIEIAHSARLFGKILFGKGVNIGENTIIVGPAIIGDNVKIGKDAVIRASVVGPGASVGAGWLIENKVIMNFPVVSSRPAQRTGKPNNEGLLHSSGRNSFRQWPAFSYARLVKRVFDILFSLIVLILFAPVIPVIMLVIKLTSPGPVFFKDTRQGLHGKPFKCLKFRTMKPGAHKMQDRLRVLNRVDGPQFMMEDDPRLSAVGEFLRETYLDEIPQFLNVLLGQMSVVGPRPSPESENRLCPFWRDARLSVRPGITGLWQMCRTRKPMRDFQEWIHFDIEYVRDLSLNMDLWICWKTAKKMITKFISQF